MPLDIEKFEASPHLLDLLVQMEDVLDSLDLYVYRNWLEGEIVEGPLVQRHWLSMSLLYPYHRMPDPRAAYRLFKHGVRVKFSHMHRAASSKDRAEEEVNASGLASPVPGGEAKKGKGEKKDDGYWLVKLQFPRRLIGQVESAAMDLDAYEDEVDAEDVEDARDSGVNDESGYVDQEQQADAEAAMGGAPGEEIDRARPV